MYSSSSSKFDKTKIRYVSSTVCFRWLSVIADSPTPRVILSDEKKKDCDFVLIIRSYRTSPSITNPSFARRIYPSRMTFLTTGFNGCFRFEYVR